MNRQLLVLARWALCFMCAAGLLWFADGMGWPFAVMAVLAFCGVVWARKRATPNNLTRVTKGNKHG